jgi:hypothetical protein
MKEKTPRPFGKLNDQLRLLGAYFDLDLRIYCALEPNWPLASHIASSPTIELLFNQRVRQAIGYAAKSRGSRPGSLDVSELHGGACFVRPNG